MSQTISTTLRAPEGGAGIPATERSSRIACRPDEKAASTASKTRSPASTQLAVRRVQPRLATAALMGRPIPPASRRLQRP